MSPTAAANGQPTSAVGDDAADVMLLVFRIDGREHALPVDCVVEVVRMVAATPLPEAPAWMAGVINFRGRAIPLVDARSRLGGAPGEPELSTPIIVVEASENAAGLVVDEVVEVLPVRADALDRPATAIARAAAVTAVVRDGDRLIVVLDPVPLLEGALGVPLPFDLADARDAGR